MLRFTLRRLLQAVPTLAGVSILSFLAMQAAPGDPTTIWCFAPNITPEDCDRLRQQLGLDQPLYAQYLHWLERIVRLDFGRSFTSREPVTLLVLYRLGNTLILTGTALGLALLIGIPLGVLAAVHRGGLIDNAVRVLAAVANAVPDFWLGLLAILVFAVWLRWLPSGGMYTLGTTGDLVDRVRHLIMPALVLATGGIATYSRYVRTETLEVLQQDYVRTARAKGLPPRQVLGRHVLKNALLPVVTLSGGFLAQLFGGAVVVETIFSWPGMGRLGFDAVLVKDYPILMGLVVIVSLLIVFGYLLADLAYAWLDPRIKHA